MASVTTSAQYRLGVQIGHLLAGEIRDGMDHDEAIATLERQIINLCVAQSARRRFEEYRRPARCPCCDQLIERPAGAA